jgi:hypothetical protein
MLRINRYDINALFRPSIKALSKHEIEVCSAGMEP